MLKIEKDFKCELIDKKTGVVLFEFDAQQDGDTLYDAGFEGGGVASGNQSMTIMTEKAYEYRAFQHHVRIDDVLWLITSVRPAVRRKLGAKIGTKKRFKYILALE